jgi:hypothetical protein
MAKTGHASKPRRFPEGKIIDSEFLVQAAVLAANGRQPDNWIQKPNVKPVRRAEQAK